MDIIINELSLAGQFSEPSDFFTKIGDTVKILRVINQLKYQLLKNQSFYLSEITLTQNLYDISIDKVLRANDEFRGLIIELTKLYHDPHWDSHQKHTCVDVYFCKHTEKTCEYGLAEAVETDKNVLSFDHKDFKSNTIYLTKNKVDEKLFNIYSIDNFRTWVLELIKKAKIKLEDRPGLFPHIAISNNLLPVYKRHDRAKKRGKKKKGESHDEEIAIYKLWGPNIAKINGWELSISVTRKNDRNIYTKSDKGTSQYLSIDTENGTFELFDYLGHHKGEFDFNYVRTENPKGHSITVK